MKNIGIIVFVLMLVCCQDKNVQPNIPEPNVTPKDDVEMCSPACSHIKSLGCEEGQDLVYPGSSCNSNAECSDSKCINNKCTETCEMFCKALINEGRQLGLSCWKTITECSQIESICRSD